MLTAPARTDIFVVRHSEVHNPKDILYGRLPRFGLSERGLDQVEKTARFLSTRRIDAIYTSPLLRARQTADLLSRYHPYLRPRQSSALVEVRTSYQGEPNSILKPGFSFYDPVRSEGDETMTEIFNRVLSFLRRAVGRHPGGRIVAVTHADPIAVMRLGLECREFDNANLHSTVYPMRSSITQIVLSPGQELQLLYFNAAGSQP
jgi:probable phosphoglycerate mutase